VSPKASPPSLLLPLPVSLLYTHFSLDPLALRTSLPRQFCGTRADWAAESVRPLHQAAKDCAKHSGGEATAISDRQHPPPSRTKWTRRVPHPVLIGHVASLTALANKHLSLPCLQGALAGPRSAPHAALTSQLNPPFQLQGRVRWRYACCSPQRILPSHLRCVLPTQRPRRHCAPIELAHRPPQARTESEERAL